MGSILLAVRETMSSLDTMMDEKMAELEKKQKEFMDTVVKAKDDQIRAQNEQIEQMKEKLAMLEMKEKGKSLQERSVESVGELPPHPAFAFPAQSNLESTLPFRNFGRGPSQLPTLCVGATGQNMGVSPMVFVNDQPNLTRPERSKNQGFGQVFSDENANKWKMIEDRLEAIEKTNDCFGLDASQLSLVPDLVLPPKFKAPEFEKFDGFSCPVAHLKMYCRKMTGFIKNDKLLIHCFQDSLSGSAARWYNQLSSTTIRTWMDLSGAFRERYKHLIYVAPTRMTLLGMSKRPDESFREYAHRWKDMAMQVHPPVEDKELPTLFIGTLKTPFYNLLLAINGSSFSELVTAGEMIEDGIKSGRIADAGIQNFQEVSSEQDEIDAVEESKIMLNTSPQSANPDDEKFLITSKSKTAKNQFTPIPISYGELYSQLLERQMVEPLYLEPMKPPFPKWYNDSVRCVYHAGNPGHTIENCLAFKKRVQKLLNSGEVEFEAPKG